MTSAPQNTSHLTKCRGEEEEDNFTFFPPGKGPEIKHRVTKERAKRAILEAYNELTKEDEETKPTCWDRISCKSQRKEEGVEKEGERKEDETTLSPQLQKASSQGINMMKNVFFPSMPALLQDLWVYLELSISLFAFIFGLVTFSSGTGTQRTFNIAYLALAVVGIILSLIDGFIFIFFIGNLAKLVRKYLKSRKQRHQESDIEQDRVRGENHEAQRKWCRCIPKLPEKWLTRFNQFFEVGRNILSELLLYPLLVCDLFDFIALGGSQPENAEGRTNFGLFCVGSFYLLLAVYVMRIVTIVGTMVSMLRLPLQAAGGRKQYVQLMARFCFHALRQIFVHLLIVLAVAAKIRNENPQVLEDEDPINISPFLWSTMFLGWLIPLAGVFIFFVVNYYWTKEFSISFWVDMISLLQGQGFAETVFGGEGLSATKETAQHVAEDIKDKKLSPEAKQKTLDFVEKSGLNDVKQQLKRFKSPSVLVKYFHPLKLPLLSLSGLLYDVCLIAFVVSLALTRDSENGVRVALSDDNFLLATFILVIVFTLLANFHLLILANIGLAVILFLAILAAICVVMSIPFLILVYIPIAAIIGCYQYWISMLKIFRASGAETKQEEMNNEKEGTESYHKETDINGVLPKYEDLEPVIAEKELTQLVLHQEDADDIVTDNFVGNPEPRHKDANGVLPKHEDLGPQKEPTQPHEEDNDDMVAINFVGM